ncbi:MAG: hypothetical protein AAF471_09605, partial [Myxococcota bacterium]
MRICILGATGLTGNELLTLIDRAWPGADLALFASRTREVERHGKTLSIRAATDLETEDAPRGDVAFVALDDDHSKRYVPRLLELGYRVIDKSNTYRMDPEVVLGVAGVNHNRVTDATRLVANPNCTRSTRRPQARRSSFASRGKEVRFVQVSEQRAQYGRSK